MGDDSHVWRHSEMVVASRRSLWQMGHVIRATRRSRFTLTTCAGPAVGASASSVSEVPISAFAASRGLLVTQPRSSPACVLAAVEDVVEDRSYSSRTSIMDESRVGARSGGDPTRKTNQDRILKEDKDPRGAKEQPRG